MPRRPHFIVSGERMWYSVEEKNPKGEKTYGTQTDRQLSGGPSEAH